AALTGVVPMAASADDTAFATAMAAAGGAYLGAAGAHTGERAAYATGQSVASISYVLNELISAAKFSF
ncbi:MAG: PE family protein, partial [Mycobacterium sp.]